MILSAFIIFWAALAAGILFIVASVCKLILSLLEEGWAAVRLAVEAAVFFAGMYVIGYLGYGLMAKEFRQCLMDLLSFAACIVVAAIVLIALVMCIGYILGGIFGFVLEYVTLGVSGGILAFILTYGGIAIEFLGTISDKGFHRLINVINSQAVKLKEAA